MRIDIRQVTLDATFVAGLQPGVPADAMIKRQVSEGLRATPSAAVPLTDDVYHILQSKIDDTPVWSTSSKTPEVIIPLFPYVFSESAELLVKLGAQIGAVAMALAANRHVNGHLFVVTSQVFGRPDGVPGYCVYAGVAAC